MTPSKRIAALDALRVLAIAWVILYHLLDRFLPRTAGDWFTRFCESGGAGVDLFFVLSGYLIGSLVVGEIHRTSRLDVGRFLPRRWLRTLPAYYVTLVVVLGVDFVFPASRPWEQPASYLIFLQNYTNTPATFRFGWSWSLCVEEWFYLTLPLLVAVGLWCFGPSRARLLLRAIAGSAFLLSVLGRLHAYLNLQQAGLLGSEDGYWSVYLVTHYRLDGLAAGLLLSTVPKPSAKVAVGVLIPAVVGIGAFVFADWPLFVRYQAFAIWALLFGAVVYAALCDRACPRRRVPGLAPAADLAYALYLTHPIFTKAVSHLFGWAPIGVQLAVFAAVTVAASLLLRFAVELPCLRLRDRLAAAGSGDSARAGTPRESCPARGHVA
jgi:peptidoglycan/LPS O-acetylase OafA/YrhL